MQGATKPASVAQRCHSLGPVLARAGPCGGRSLRGPVLARAGPCGGRPSRGPVSAGRLIPYAADLSFGGRGPRADDEVLIRAWWSAHGPESASHSPTTRLGLAPTTPTAHRTPVDQVAQPCMTCLRSACAGRRIPSAFLSAAVSPRQVRAWGRRGSPRHRRDTATRVPRPPAGGRRTAPASSPTGARSAPRHRIRPPTVCG